MCYLQNNQTIQINANPLLYIDIFVKSLIKQHWFFDMHLFTRKSNVPYAYSKLKKDVYALNCFQ